MQNKKRIVFLCCVLIVCLCMIFVVGKIFLQENKEDVYEKMQDENEIFEEKDEEEDVVKETVEIPIDFQSLQSQNEDIYAWIQIPGTVVDYPILQHPEDDSYYLNRTVEKRQGLPGSIYTEALNQKDFSDRNTLIYGHNMKNGSMFGDLSRYMDSSYMQEHNRIVIYTPEHIYTYQVFAAVTYDNRHIMYAFDFTTEAGLQEFLDSIFSVRNMSGYIDQNVEVHSSDKIITLSTCTGNKSRRFLVEAVLVDVQ